VGLRLRQTLRRATPLHRPSTIARGLDITAETLKASVDLARARGAVPLILAPQMTPDTAEEAALRRRLLDDQGMPYIHVVVDPAFHLPHNRHPDPRGAAVISRAASAYLRAHGVAPDVNPAPPAASP
jgi:transposase-like protein